MKTFKELQDYACLLAPLDTYSKINKWASKEYAKQWVKKALEETHETHVTALVEEYEKQIDAQ